MMRRTLAGLAAAAALVVPAPSAAAPEAGPIGPTTVPALQQPLQQLQQLEESVGALPSSGAQATGLATDLVGWSLSAIGLAVTAGSQAQVEAGLQDIAAGLNGIQQSLSVISTQLAQLSAELQLVAEEEQWADCAAQTQTGSEPVAVIQAAADEYTQFLSQTTNADDSAPPPEVDAMVDWANDYTQTQGNSLMTALIAIDDMLMGTSQTSSLKACGQALAMVYEDADLTFEQSYYTALYQYLAYWYQVQVQGLTLYVEAQHVLALDAAGELSQFQPTEPSAICTEPISGAVTNDCQMAYNAVTTVYDNLEDQLYAAGAPYIWGTGGQVTASPPAVGSKAWLVDINDFGTDGCTLPLTSNTPACGDAVGTDGPLPATWGAYSWGSYSGWRAAVTKDWLDLFPASYQTSHVGQFWQYMTAAGFGDAQWGTGKGLQNLLVYTGEITASQNPVLNAASFGKATSDYQNVVEGMCVLDTQAFLGQGYNPNTWVRPLCDDAGGGVLSALVADFDPAASTWFGIAPNGGDGEYWGGGDFTDGTRFYNANLLEGPKGMPWQVVQLPGWMTGTFATVGGEAQALTFTPVPQYRWPTLPLSDAACTVTAPTGGTMPAVTAGGAYTMCGPDFAAWVALQLPPAPVPASALGVTTRPGLGKAVVTWRKSPGQRHVAAYRVRGSRDGGAWRTVRTAPATARNKNSMAVRVAKPGWWRFRVVTIARHGASRPSAPSRPAYIATKVHASRYYTFRRGGVVRVAKAFSDGRVYFAGRHLAGVGELRRGRVTGHTYRGPHRWAGTWTQPTSGAWNRLSWTGWTRVEGPARTRAGMPFARASFPRW
jgi:hypothetical protein